MSPNDTHVRTLLIVVAVIVLLPFLMMALTIPMMGMWGGGMMSGGMMDGGMWGGSTMGGTWFGWLIAWLLPLVIVVGVGYLLYRGITRGEDRESDPAIEELRSAYARGELTDEEFEKRRERLEQDR